MNLRLEHSESSDNYDGTELTTEVNERRHHRRSLRVMRVARIALPELDSEGLGMVRDVSPGGMMIDAHLDLELGQTVAIALLDDQELSGTVAWKEGSMLGIQFAEEVEVEDILARPTQSVNGKRARMPRFNVNMAVQLKTDIATVDATLHDISQRGAKLQSDAKLRVHTNLLIRADGHKAIAATIKWRAGDMLGVEFHRLLAVGELELWIKP